MNDLPPGWILAEIGSLCSLENGRAFKPTEWSNTGLPIVRIQNLNNSLAPYNHYDGEFADRYHLYGGELLFAWSGTPGTSFGAHVWRGGEAVLNQHIFRVDFDQSAINKRFLRFAINQKLNQLIDIAHGGVGLRHVTKGKFEGTEIALAPLNEQKRIADKLDAVLAKVDACRDRLDRIPVILKRFRQSILAAAASGNLTQDWREQNPSLSEDNLARLVLKEIQNRKITWINENHQHNEVSRVQKRVNAFSEENVFETTGLPDSWIWAKLEDVVLMVVDCHNKTAPYENSGIPLVRTTNIRDGRFIWDDLRYVTEETYQYWSKRCFPEPGDVVFTREAPMGEAAIIPPGTKICLGQRTMLFRPIEDQFFCKIFC
ncbi:restriction endonuclease subunit S [Methylocucumis oryzae]|uniref:restriction endonuclease subunit S n=1 Tax=Methylocucumis oryzae TaxID=1632867 RepID=UPI0006967336|nr:restriction endonuclease subunit S [Methylocucumis oryzae]